MRLFQPCLFLHVISVIVKEFIVRFHKAWGEPVFTQPSFYDQTSGFVEEAERKVKARLESNAPRREEYRKTIRKTTPSPGGHFRGLASLRLLLILTAGENDLT